MSERITKLNGTAISTYGLILKNYSGELDFSGRKKTTEEWNFGVNDIFKADKKITFEFYGKYSSELALGTAVAAFAANVQSVIEGSIEVDHPDADTSDYPTITYIGRFISGASVRPTYGNAVFITLVMTWQGKTE